VHENATPKNRAAVDTGERKDGDGTSVEEAQAGVMDAAKAEGGALLHVRCFGEFVVTSGDRAISASDDEGASYKAWEILAFLAAQPGGAVSKEKLITAIWPDIEPGRAANRMRVAMARLRALLARQVPGLSSEVVRCERDGTCRVDTKLVWSDAQEFLKLCQAGAKLPLEQARELYRGDLLSGRGTRFYEWVEDRAESGISLREHFREEFYQATLRLARLYRDEGQVTLAVSLYKCLLRAEPTLEDIVRELYRCYQQLGDLSSLLRQDRDLRQALREAYLDPEYPEDDSHYDQPEPETVALFNEIRSELEAQITQVRAGRRQVIGQASSQGS
jgi:DNA-binding SARP family transcriptional activator